MPLILKRKPVAPTAAPKQEKRPYSPRFNMVMSISERDALHEIAAAYGRELGVNLSAAFIIRLALEDALPKMRADLNRAKTGRYHAKIRKEYSLV